MMRSILLFALIAAGPLAQANKIIGNGGMVLECKSPPYVRLLDFVEAEKVYYVAPGMPRLTLSDPEGATYREKLMSVIQRVSGRFPELARQILLEVQNFEDHKLIAPDLDLGSTGDDYSSYKPKECSLPKQIAIQNEPLFPRSPWFQIDELLWNRLDERSKAGLVLHEAVYRIGIRNGAEQSVGVRYLVGLLFANELDQIADEDWIAAFFQSRIKYYEVNSVKIPLFTGEAPCTPVPGTAICTRSENLRMADVRFNSERRLMAITFAGEPNQMPEKVEFTTDTGIRVSLHVKEMRFDWSRENVEILTQGRLSLTASSFGGRGSLTADIDGRIVPATSMFEGTQAVFDHRVRDPVVREFRGTFQNMITYYGMPVSSDVRQVP